MDKWDVPGASVAIAKDGRLLFAKGYGVADVESRDPVAPDSLFRIASISKPITAVAVLKLVEEGQLGLDEHVFTILDEFSPPEGSVTDPSIKEITVRQLLQHSGGWNRERSFDPMWSVGRIGRGLGVPKPVSCRDVITFMLGRPLDFEPGSEYAYSNFGYCLLGRIIEEKTGLSYEKYVKESVLEPMGIAHMSVGGTLPEDRARGEVTYYSFPGQGLAHSVLPGTPDMVPWPYGGFHLKMMDAHGGWVGSVIDLLRFVTSVDGSRDPRFLEPETVALMVERPASPLWQRTPYYYGMGWSIRPMGEEATWWHNGSQPGSVSLLVRTYHGYAWSVLFNSRPEEWSRFANEVNQLMWRALQQVPRWPSEDLFP